MRRSRSQKPDMFPFLAVLLCAMGSLIVVLLILDRQARRVAQQKAEQAQRPKGPSPEDLERARKEKALIEQYRQQLSTIQARIQTIEREAVEKRKALDDKQTEIAAVARSIEEEQERRGLQSEELKEARDALAQLEADVSRKKEDLEKLKAATRATNRMHAELLRSLDMLKVDLALAAKTVEKQQRTWSIVPYAGTRGKDQTPLYVVCSKGGLTFHPDHFLVTGGDDAIPQIRNQVLRRRARYRSLEKNKDQAYWMLLVRPNGIIRYYQFLAAIRGLDVLYGYELIDNGWEVDLPDAKTLPRKVPTPFGPLVGPGGKGPFSGTAAVTPLEDPRRLPMTGKGRGSAERNPRAGVTMPTVVNRPGSANLAGKRPTSDQGKPGNKGPGNARRGSGTQPLRPAQRVPDEDWQLVVECTPTGVEVVQSRLFIPLADLRSGRVGQAKLYQEIQRLVARQQTRLRARKSHLRPEVRFLVDRDGLRSYHLAYPALRTLPVKKTAEMKKEEDQPR